VIAIQNKISKLVRKLVHLSTFGFIGHSQKLFDILYYIEHHSKVKQEPGTKLASGFVFSVINVTYRHTYCCEYLLLMQWFWVLFVLFSFRDLLKLNKLSILV
jgi:hypothetical protein